MPAVYRCHGEHVTMPLLAEAADGAELSTMDSGVGETWVCFLHLLNKLCDFRQITPCF